MTDSWTRAEWLNCWKNVKEWGSSRAGQAKRPHVETWSWKWDWQILERSTEDDAISKIHHFCCWKMSETAAYVVPLCAAPKMEKKCNAKQMCGCNVLHNKHTPPAQIKFRLWFPENEIIFFLLILEHCDAWNQQKEERYYIEEEEEKKNNLAGLMFHLIYYYL